MGILSIFVDNPVENPPQPVDVAKKPNKEFLRPDPNVTQP